MPYHDVDFQSIAQRALDHSETLLCEWLPDGKRQGQEFVARNPTRDDLRPGSFKINLDSGLWLDAATGDKGGDLISLYAYLHRCNQPDSARSIADRLGIADQQPTSSVTKKSDWKPVLVAPASAPNPPNTLHDGRVPVGRWPYHDPDGGIVGYVYRFDEPLQPGEAKPKKEFRPLTLWRKNSVVQWRWKGFEKPRPLFNLHLLTSNPESSVVLCEGEAKCIAAGNLLKDYIPTCNSGGSNAVNSADLTPIRNRTILVWPDADEAGITWLKAVLVELQKLRCVISIINTDGLDESIGYDAKNALNDGWTIADVEKRIIEFQADRIEENRQLDNADKKAIIIIEAGQLAQIADQAESVLVKYSENYYQRSGQLVRWTVSFAETVHGITRPAGSVLINPIEPDYLLDKLNRLIDWRCYNKKKKLVTCNAPRQIALSLLARRGEWKAQPLIATINTPTIRPDGTILDKEGYDSATGLLFVNVSGIPFDVIPDQPTKADALSALDLLKDLISGFPFAQDYDRSAALSAMMTAVVRHSMRNAPMHSFSAPRMASGKSLLADCVSLLSTGKPATVMSFTPDGDEMRKRVLTLLMAGDAVINIDNVEEPLQSQTLCSVLTQESFTDRILGGNKSATVPTLACWLATGNNLVVSGDLTTRMLLCNLDPQVERPEEREFSRNLYDWIPANRQQLVTAVLNILRAYIVAGRPKQPIKNFARFEDWSRSVRSALIWLGEADPLLGLEKLENADPVREKLRALLIGWYSTFKSAPATSQEAIFAAFPEKTTFDKASKSESSESSESTSNRSTFRFLLLDHFTGCNNSEPNSRNIGNFLKKHAGRIEIGARFERAGSAQRREFWKVRVVEQRRFEKELLQENSQVERGIVDSLDSLDSLFSPDTAPKSKPVCSRCRHLAPVVGGGKCSVRQQTITAISSHSCGEFAARGVIGGVK